MTDLSAQQYAQILKGLGQTSGGLSSWLQKYSPDTSSALSTGANYAGGAGNVAGIVGGIQSGSPTGYLGAGTNALQLGSRTGALGSLGMSPSQVKGVNAGATDLMDALGLYQGIQKGGVTGYGQALGSGMQLAGNLAGNAALSTAGGYVLAPLAVYNAIANYQGGKTGVDALQGAEAGAAVGSVVPVIGTAIGAIAGGALGAIASGFDYAHDPETDSWGGLTNAYNQVGKQYGATGQQQLMSQVQNPYQDLAGLFDLRGSQITGNIPIYDQYGRMGEQKFTSDMLNQINQGIQSGKINPNMDASQIYSSVVNPWINSFGKGTNTDPNAGEQQALLTQMISQYMGGQAPSAWTDVDGGKPFANVMPATLPQPGPSSKTASPAEIAQTNAATASLYGNSNSPLASLKTATPGAAPPAQPSMQYNPTPQPMMQANEYGLNSIGHAEGGSMKRKKSALDELYRGSFKDRQHFDDGGYVDYFGTPQGGGSSNYDDLYVPPDTNLQKIPVPSGSGQAIDTNNPFGAGSAYDPNTGFILKDGVYYDDQGNVIGGAPSKTSQDLQNLKNNISGDNGITGWLNLLKGIAPVAGAIANRSTGANTKPPVAAPGMTFGATAPPVPSFARTQVQQPSNTGNPMSLQDWYSYGSRPEASFFQNNQVPLALTTGISQGQAKGGAQHSALSTLDPDSGLPEFDSQIEHHVEGPGDGTSDDIPAKLSDGEYVMDSNSVSMLGNGSNKAGAERLDQLRSNLRKHAAGPMKKGKQFMKAKPPEQYMKGGKEKKGG